VADDPNQLRKALFQNGFRPVAYPAGEKFSTEIGWQDLARRNPPAAVSRPHDSRLSNTGILCDELCPVDVDVTDADAVWRIADWCLRNLGDAPIRYRANACKMLLLYRADVGCPSKRAIRARQADNELWLIECLGVGNQFHAFGVHPTGARLEWLNDISPATLHRDALTPVSAEQISPLFAFCAPLIGVAQAENDFRPIEGRNPGSNTQELWPLIDVASALEYVPNHGKDWHYWFNIASAVHAVTSGSRDGFALFSQWSAQSSADNPAYNLRKWNSLSRNSGVHSGGTLTHHARQGRPDWLRPSRGLMDLPKFF
jgi:hypothetical protein